MGEMLSLRDYIDEHEGEGNATYSNAYYVSARCAALYSVLESFSSDTPGLDSNTFSEANKKFIVMALNLSQKIKKNNPTDEELSNYVLETISNIQNLYIKASKDNYYSRGETLTDIMISDANICADYLNQ